MKLILLILIAYTNLHADIRPKALSPQKNCELWIGTASGNDPSVQVELSICENRKKELTGVLQWSSIKSGWNKRAVNGYKKENTMLLRDEKFLENKPNKGWMFCLIDEYSFSISKNTMQGVYESKGCRDRAMLSLTLKFKNSTP